MIAEFKDGVVGITDDEGAVLVMHLTRDVNHRPAGLSYMIYIFEDVNGFDRPCVTEWVNGQCVRSQITN